MNIQDILNWSSSALIRSQSADIDARALLKSVLEVDDAWLIANARKGIDKASENRFRELVAARSRGIPVAYLLKSREFWSRDLYIDSRVLVPRHETETLVERVLDCAVELGTPSILELGTGSGAVAVALSVELPDASILATDISEEALAVARKNIARHGCRNVVLQRAAWFSGLGGQRVDVICSNPPYVASGDSHLESPELKSEPLSSLVAGVRGLDALEAIAREAPDHLKPCGWLLLEHGYEQAMDVREILMESGFRDVRCFPDLAGRDRVTRGRRADHGDP